MNAVLSRKWFRLGVVNLTIVALYGTLMRYKIAFDFPFLVQKNLLHAHSHFAFSGWVSRLLYSGLAMMLSSFVPLQKQKKYNILIAFNIFCAFGMLASFTVQGYKAVSIIFSTFSIFIAAAYAFFFIRDIKYLPPAHPSKSWAITGLLLNAVIGRAFLISLYDGNEKYRSAFLFGFGLLLFAFSVQWLVLFWEHGIGSSSSSFIFSLF